MPAVDLGEAIEETGDIGGRDKRVRDAKFCFLFFFGGELKNWFLATLGLLDCFGGKFRTGSRDCCLLSDYSWTPSSIVARGLKISDNSVIN